jgi:ribosomal protein S18 acetylase RimI-like enzyme
MIDVLENEAKKQGMTELRLRTSTQQLMAQQFYEKNGYQKIITDTKEYYTEGGGDAFEVLWYRKTI